MISCVAATDREPNDALSERYLDRLEAFVTDSGARGLADYGNKFVAHAADAYSRSHVAIDGLNFSMIETMHRGLYRAAHRFFIDVIEDSQYSPMPMSTYDQLEHMTERWADDEAVMAMHAFWDARKELMDSWGNDGLQ